MTDTATASPPPTCEARTGFTPGEFGFLPTPCGQTRGLRVLVDGQGRNHYFCAAAGHGESVAISNGAMRQFGAMPTNRPMYEGMD